MQWIQIAFPEYAEWEEALEYWWPHLFFLGVLFSECELIQHIAGVWEMHWPLAGRI